MHACMACMHGRAGIVFSFQMEAWCLRGPATTSIFLFSTFRTAQNESDSILCSLRSHSHSPAIAGSSSTTVVHGGSTGKRIQPAVSTPGIPTEDAERSRNVMIQDLEWLAMVSSAAQLSAYGFSL